MLWLNITVLQGQKDFIRGACLINDANDCQSRTTSCEGIVYEVYGFDLDDAKVEENLMSLKMNTFATLEGVLVDQVQKKVTMKKNCSVSIFDNLIFGCFRDPAHRSYWKYYKTALNSLSY